MRWTSGSAHASSHCSAPTAQLGARVAARSPATSPMRCDELALDVLEDRGEQVLLVGELVVERAARDAGRATISSVPTSRVAALGEQRPGGGDERRAGGLGPSACVACFMQSV